MPDENEVPERAPEWSPRNKTVVRQIWGAIVGTLVVVYALIFGSHVLEDGHLTLIEATFVGGLALAGLLAAMPSVFMPSIYRIVDAWQTKRGGRS